MTPAAAQEAGATVETMGLEGEICIDLVNTGSGRSRGPFVDRLNSYADLLTWGRRVGALDDALADELAAEAARHPQRAAAVVTSARELREAIYRIFTEHARSHDAPRSDLERVSAAAAEASPHQRLVQGPGGFELEWPRTSSLERVLWPVSASAVALLVSDDIDRVKECAADNCNWLFLDASRNHSRQWCDMKVCGNRAKARRFQKRRKTREPSS